MKKFIFALLVVLLESTAQAGIGSYPIMQGSTSMDVAHFTIVAPDSEKLEFVIEGPTNGSTPRVTPVKVAYQGHDYAVWRLRVEGLRPGVDYALAVNSGGRRTDRRVFRSLDVNAPTGRVAVGSCMIRQLHNSGVWRNMALPENRPDLFLILGDAVYLDRSNLLFKSNPTSGLEIWDQFVKARLEEDLYKWDRLVPILTTWDDHDAAGDGSDGKSPLINESRKIYETFFANDAIPGFLERGPGLAKQFKVFGKNYVMLDGRSFRNLSESDPLFGREQNEFLIRSLKPGPNFLVNGIQFYGRYLEKDSMEYDWPEYTTWWTSRVRQAADRVGATLAFLSGDVHFSEVQDLEPDLFGYPTVEVTSSNLHSFGLPGHYVLKPGNPRRREVTGTHNFVLLEFMDGGARSFRFRVRSVGWRGQELFNTTVSVGDTAPSIRLTSAEPLTTQPCEDILVE